MRRAGPAPITGIYDELTAEGLWRFILQYGLRRDSSWPSDYTEIEVDDGTVTLPIPGDMAGNIVHDLVHKQKKYPVLTQALVDQIAAHFTFANVPASVTLEMTHSWIGASSDEHLVVKEWGKWSDVEKTTVVAAPEPQGSWLWKGKLEYELEGAAESEVAVELESAGCYALCEPVPQNLETLCKYGVRIEPTGDWAEHDATPSLRITGNGFDFEIELGGTPNFMRDGQDGFAAALLQQWMKLKKDKRDRPYYSRKIDGDWADGSTSAWDRIVEDLGGDDPSRDYMLALLIPEHAPPPPPEPAVGPSPLP